MADIENPSSRRGPNIHTLISRATSIAYDKGLLAYARYIRGLLGRPEDTLKAALVEAAYYSTWGKENMPIAEQEELEKIKRKEEALEAKRQAGRDSGRVSAEEKTERNVFFQNEINKLCIEDGMGYKKATEKLSEAVKGSKWELSARRIRDYVKNPKTE